MRHLIRLCIGTTAAMTFAVAAQAADVRAPVSKAPAVTWTGWYFGGSAGYGWSNSHVDPVGSSAFCNPAAAPGLAFPACAPSQFSSAQATAIAPALFTHPSGGMLGGHIGYNYRSNSLVTGVETDISWTSITGSNTQTAAQPVFSAFVLASPIINAQAIAEQKLRYFGTLRGRLGYLPAESLLIFVTGGLAYGQVKSSTTVAEAITSPTVAPCACGAITPGLGSASTTRAGWTAGFGLEYAYESHWSFKAEYLYFDLGTISYPSTTLTLADAAGTPFTAVAVASTMHFTGSIFRLGLNYRPDN